jgi:hypothetical protein
MKTRLLATGLMASSLTIAAPTLASDLRIDGFASMVYGQVIDKDELGAQGPNFRRYDDKAEFQVDSLYGIQFRSNLQEGLSVTGQLVGKGSDDFNAKVTWAYFTYEVNDQLSIKVGRQRLPFFLYSDFLDVGYAYAWVSPPFEVYDLGGFDNLDGVNFEYQTELGDWTSRLNFLVGASDSIVEVAGNSATINSEDFWDVTWNMNRDWFTFQLTYTLSSATVDSYSAIADGANSLISLIAAPLTEDQYNQLTVENDRAEFVGIGVAGDWGTWIASAEYTTITLDDSPTSNDRSAWYLMGGYRWNKFTFSATYAEYESLNNDKTIEVLDTVVEPALGAIAGGATGNDALQAGAAQLLANLDAAYRGGVESNSYTLTMRYDFHPSAAFKMDYSQQSADYDLSNGSAITTLEPSLIRMGVDLVF